jgi:hypothetical protein
VRNIEALDAIGRVFQTQRILQRSGNSFRCWFQHAETLLETVARVRFHQLQHGFLLAALRGVYLDFTAALFR